MLALEAKGEEIHEWDVKNSTEMEEFHPDQPIPHVVQLTDSGVLQIGWDRPMRVPANFSLI